MNRLILVLASLAVHAFAVAQSGFPVQHRIYVGGGISMAPESLAGIESVDNKGYVENGPTIAVNYVAKLHRYFGVGGTIGHSRNNLNAEAIGGASSSTVQAEPYALTFLMADLYGFFPVKQWGVYGKGGLGTIIPAKWEMQVSNSLGSGSVVSGRKFVPAYTAAIGVNYALGKVEVGLESGLLASKPKFEFDSGKSVTYKKQWLSSFNYTIKAGFHF